MIWILYGVAALAITGLAGFHLARFRHVYTEMNGMMIGMTMGMLNGFLLGYAAAGIFSSMFWGNMLGVLLGTALGIYFGRAGGLMGVMDGGMAGLMGGSMSAMLMLMLVWRDAIAWTALLLALVYLAGMIGLVVLIEQADPEQAILLPFWSSLTRSSASRSARPSTLRRAPIDDYYTFLGIPLKATGEEITAAYLNQLSIADDATIARAERAYSILTDPKRRAVYDARLASNQAAGDCCPPARAKQPQPVSAPVSVKQSRAANAKQPHSTKVAAATRPSSRPSPRKQPRKESPISWVGVVVAFGIVTTLVIWWLATQAPTSISTANAFTDNGRSLPAEFVNKLQAGAVDVPIAADGRQSLPFVVNGTSMSYKPPVLRVKQGVPVHFDLSVEGRDPGCGRFVGLAGLGVHGIANPGETTTLDFTPDRAGIFQINCNMQMMSPGYLIVTE
jgi:hypothetical protein